MSNGNWIKLHRQLLNSAVFDNEKLLKVWIWCLLKATYIEYEQLVGRQLVTLKPGQFVFGRKKAAVELGIAESSVRDYMKLLESVGSITIKATNKYSIITVCQWGLYQSQDNDSDNKSPSNHTTDQQQINTNKNIKNIKKEDHLSKRKIFDYQEILNLYHDLCPSLPKVIKLNSNRKSLIKARYREYGIEGLTTLFKKAESSDFLSGRSGNWKGANLDWLIKDSNCLKTLEGNYDNRPDTINMESNHEGKSGPRFAIFEEEEYEQNI